MFLHPRRPPRRLIAGLICGSFAAGAAAQGVQASRVQPITVPLQDAGTYNVVTRVWTPRGALSQVSGGPQTVFNNTCTWPTAPFAYLVTEHCETVYDEGRIPSTSDPNAPLGATDDNNITQFNFAYCTPFVTGTVDLSVDFYDNLGGICLGGVQPPANPPSAGSFDFGAPLGFPLPGAAVQGQLACWLVTIDLTDPTGSSVGSTFCLQSDGDGVFDNDPSNDLFTWRFQHEMNSALASGVPSGAVLGGHPPSAAPGACSYGIPCGSDAFGSCGTGLGSVDNLWNQTDNTPPYTPPNVPGCPGAGLTGCFFFGYPNQGPFASLYLTLQSSGSCAGCTGLVPTTYCTAKVNSLGCTPAMDSTGIPSKSLTSGFTIKSRDVRNNKSGLLFYGMNGAAALPFQGGTLCVATPIRRTPAVTSGGTAPPANDCSGLFQIDFNAFMATGSDPALVAGAAVHTQWWGRDPGFAAPNNTTLSNGLTFVICP
jgi:hypothetical protein